MKNNFWISVFGVLLFTVLILFLYFKFNTTGYLNFSDAAKSADIARNIVNGLGYNGTFSFWSSGILDSAQKMAFPSPWLPPLMPYSIALSFLIFGVSDMSVMVVSMLYFVLLILFAFLLGRKLFGNLAGILGGLTVAVNTDFLNYATNSATESVFTLEIVASAYLLTLKNKWATFFGFILMILMYFTRPQGFIYIAGLMLYWLLMTFKSKKAILTFSLILIVGFIVDYFILSQFAGKYFLYSVTGRGLGTATQVVSGGSASDSLRGEMVAVPGLTVIVKKLFYNLYNYYKLSPQILSPYLVAFFVLSLFKWGEDKTENSLKISTLFMFFMTVLVASLSIPFFRYIHPIVPLVYLFAVGAIVKIVDKAFVSTVLILLFVVGQTFGVIFLDSRFVSNTKNVGRPPVYVVLSEKLKEDTSSEDVIITNLDTWGSWYGNRTTVWFPVDPEMLSGANYDAIYLTSYRMDDQNYYMGKAWREIFENPAKQKILSEYKFVKEYKIDSNDNYERQDAKAVLLIRKQ